MTLKGRKQYVLLTLAVFLANYFADRGTKFLATNFLPGKEPVRLLRNLIVILYTENQGAFLSLGTAWPAYLKYTALLIAPIAVCAAALIYLMFRETDKTRIILISSIIAGGMGNLVDRLVNDFRVIDFLNFGIGSLRTGVLNVADLSVTFGTLAFLWYELKNSRKEGKEGKSHSQDDKKSV
jgi:signal peptidase II